jgi:hypothetical protein
MKCRHLFQIHAAYKIFFLGTVLLAASLIASAQNIVAVAPVKMNLLYVGVDNPVSVVASGSTDDKVTVSIVGGGATVSKMEAGLYNVRVTTPTNDCIMNVYVNGKLAGTSSFRVRNLPQPKGSIGGFTSGSYLSADALRSKPGLSVYVENSPLEMKYDVVSFRLVVADKDKIKTAECRGALFSETARQYMNQYLKPGDIVTIENIMVKDAEGKLLKLPSLLYNIN